MASGRLSLRTLGATVPRLFGPRVLFRLLHPAGPELRRPYFGMRRFDWDDDDSDDEESDKGGSDDDSGESRSGDANSQ